MFRDLTIKSFLVIALSICIAGTFPLLPQEDLSGGVTYAAQNVAAKSIKLSRKSYKLSTGNKFTLKATISPANASNKKVVWKSSNTKIATVSKKGIVKAAKNPGKVTITATIKGTKKKATCTVYVSKGKLGKVSKTVVYDQPFALMNEYGAFLSVAKDNDTLILSNKPYMWRLVKGSKGSHIVSEKNKDLLFDLENAWYSAGNKVHLYGDTGDSCQYWNLTPSGKGFIITSAMKPSWCVASSTKGFILEKKKNAGKNEIWKIITGGVWANGYVSYAKSPFYQWEKQTYTPTPDFWKQYDLHGITKKMRAADSKKDDIYAQYACANPIADASSNRFDFFSVDFYTNTQPDATYWSLANWGMDSSEYMKRHGYTNVDTVGAYAGLQVADGKTKKIMSMWETYFSNDKGDKYVLVPKCIYPSGSTQFDNEGSGTSLVAPFKWKAKTWYRFILKSWKKGDTTYIGTWIKDLSTGKLTKLVVYDTLLPDSCIVGLPTQFLENFGSGTHGKYRQMKLRNYSLHCIDTDEWIFPDTAEMSIWATNEVDHRGTYRFSADKGIIKVETCGIGKNVCKGKTDEETIFTVHMQPATKPPKM